jgi:NTP pyrophosphatase (non-canonical NTP hydrolase)
MKVKQDEKIPRIMWRMALLQKTMDVYGVDNQLDMLVEECAELIVAVQHYKRDRIGLDAIANEAADVRIMISQIGTLPNMADAMMAHESAKLERLEARLNKHLEKVDSI